MQKLLSTLLISAILAFPAISMAAGNIRSNAILPKTPEAAARAAKEAEWSKRNKDGMSAGDLSEDSPADDNRLLSEMDKDGDGKVSKSEFMTFSTSKAKERAEKRFGMMDQDKDGYWTPGENRKKMKTGPKH